MKLNGSNTGPLTDQTRLALLACAILNWCVAANVLAQERPDVLWMTNATGYGSRVLAFSPDGSLLACLTKTLRA